MELTNLTDRSISSIFAGLTAGIVSFIVLKLLGFNFSASHHSLDRRLRKGKNAGQRCTTIGLIIGGIVGFCIPFITLIKE
jgi:hypothetical protein